MLADRAGTGDKMGREEGGRGEGREGKGEEGREGRRREREVGDVSATHWRPDRQRWQTILTRAGVVLPTAS